MKPAAAVACATGLALAARALLVLVTVEGASMEPGLRPGDRLLVLRCPPARLRRGRVVLLSGPFGPPDQQAPGAARYAVKRLAALPGDPAPAVPGRPVGRVPPGQVAVLGDNPPRSSDSREWGTLPRRQVVGVALIRQDRSAPGPQGTRRGRRVRRLPS